MSSLDMFRIVEELKSTVSEVLEDLVHDNASHLSKLDKVWEQVVKPIIIKELADSWQKVAKLGRTLEEAARCDNPSCFISLSGLPVMGQNMTSVIAEVLKATLTWRGWFRRRRGGDLKTFTHSLEVDLATSGENWPIHLAV